MSEKEGGDAPQNAQDLTVFVQSLLEQMVRASRLILPLFKQTTMLHVLPHLLRLSITVLLWNIL